MLRKTLLTLSASTMLSAGAIAPNAAHAFGPPPLLGGPPHLPGPNGPAGLSHLGGPGFHGGGHGMFTVSKTTLQPMATATPQRIATAIQHAMATAMASGDTATGDVMTSLSMAVMATTLMAIPLPMVAPTPTAKGDTGVFWFAMQTE